LCQKYFTKNYQNLIIGFQVTLENVGDTFLRHSPAYANAQSMETTQCYKV